MKFRRITAIAVIVAIVSISAAAEGQAGGGIQIAQCGQTVTQSAFLIHDLYCPGQAGIVVGADGITIDLKGFTLRGNQSANKIGVNTGGHDQVTIKNGIIAGFDSGVVALGGGASVSKMVVSGNAFYGIYLAGDSAKIQSVTSFGNGNDGIFVDVDSASVKSSTAVGNGDNGIVVAGVSGRVQSSEASGNGTNGIDVGGASARILSSTASGNGDYGIHVAGDAPQINGNRADGNGFDVVDFGQQGIRATGYATAPVGKNIARGNDSALGCLPTFLC
jgi:hypothetical protein